jgi:hypothetical protein
MKQNVQNVRAAGKNGENGGLHRRQRRVAKPTFC